MTTEEELHAARAALRDVFDMFDHAQLIQGQSVISCATVFGWTCRHGHAIEAAVAQYRPVTGA